MGTLAMRNGEEWGQNRNRITTSYDKAEQNKKMGDREDWKKRKLTSPIPQKRGGQEIPAMKVNNRNRK